MLNIGTILKEKYKVVRRLKVGGMGFVHEGDYNGNRCVIKEPKINGEIEKDKIYLEKIKIEAEILGKIKYNSIVEYIDSFEERNSFFLVEKYISGETLAAKYYENPCNENDITEYILQLLDAVKYLHNKNITHRDINPNNLILSPDKKLVLIDFGTAKYFHRGRKEIKGIPESIVGTPYYTSPEQWEGHTNEISDIFSIGRTLYFILVGKLPPESPYKKLDLSGIRISKELANIVIKAAEPEMIERYESVEQMIFALNTLEKPLLTIPQIGSRLIVGAKIYRLGDYTTIGSDRYRIANILIPDPDPKGPYIERIHAVIKKEKGQYWIYDNLSKFGTFIEEDRKKILITPRKDVIQYLKHRGYKSPKSIMEKSLLKDGSFISLAWDPILGEYISMQFKEN